jgi:para-nitrobenzyl esterase
MWLEARKITDTNEGSLLPADARIADVFPELSESDLANVKSLYGTEVGSDAALAPLLFRDVHFTMPSRWVAAHEAAGANHGSEIPFVFATWPDFRLTTADQQVTQLLHGCWVAFAKTGTPVCPDAPAWPAYSVGSDVWMRFAAHPAAESVSDKQILDLLQSRMLAGRG